MDKSRSRARVAFCLAAAFFVAYFFWFAADSLRADFTHDDLMNGWRGWFRSWPDHLRDIVLFWRFSPNYRPLGTLAYKVFLTISGLNLSLMRVFLAALILTNVYLLYAVARRLTGSREAAAFAALIGCYHSNFSHLYYNTGTCFDILCYFFYFAALLYYLRIRHQGRFLRWHEALCFCALLVLGLNSKEMAVTLPPMVASYELVFHRPGSVDSITRCALVPAIGGAIVLAYVVGRVMSPEGISHYGHYASTVSPAEYLKQTGEYLNPLFYAQGWFSPTKTAVFLLALLALSWRSAVLLYCWLLLTIGILPLAFIPHRSLSAAIIPMAGLVIYAAVLLARMRDWIQRLLRAGDGRPVFGLYPRNGFVVFVALAMFLARAHAKHRTSLEPWVEQPLIRGVIEQWRQLHPSVPKGGRVLIIKDPFGSFTWASAFIGQLLYRELVPIHRLETLGQRPDAKAISEYTYVLTYEDGRLKDAQRPGL